MGYDISLNIREKGDTTPCFEDGYELGSSRDYYGFTGAILHKLDVKPDKRHSNNPVYILIPKDKFIEMYEIVSSMKVSNEEEEYRQEVYEVMTRLFQYLDTHEIWYVYE